LLQVLAPFINQEVAMKLALAVSALALTGLAACTTYYDDRPAPGAVTTTGGAPVVSAGSNVAPVVVAPATVVTPVSAYRPGYGIIESISLVTLPYSATAGGTLPPVVSGPYRVTIRMDDGSIQTMMVDNRAFLVGDRVQIMGDGRLIRP
jgi:hypothetical protein